MRQFARLTGLLLAGTLAAASAAASELSYTFLDFESFRQTVDISGSQRPVPDQLVVVDSGSADGIGIGGSLIVGDRFFLGGEFTNSVVDITGTITSPLTEVPIVDTYDLVTNRLSFGYILPVGEDLDLLFDISRDTRQVDFGSLAGENFDVNASGMGAGFGLRWNPTRAVELYGQARYSKPGKIQLDRLDTASDTLFRAGVRWYFFEDLAVGLDYESGQTTSVSVSLRFSFGNLQW